MGGFLTLARAVRDPGKNIGYLGVAVDMEQVDNILSIGRKMTITVKVKKSNASATKSSKSATGISSRAANNGCSSRRRLISLRYAR